MNLFTSRFQQEISSEEAWEESAASSIRELAEQLGVKPSWARRKLAEFFGQDAVAEQEYRDQGQYAVTESGALRFVPGGRKIWVTVGQAQLLEFLAAEHLHRQTRRNGPVVRIAA